MASGIRRMGRVRCQRLDVAGKDDAWAPKEVVVSTPWLIALSFERICVEGSSVRLVVLKWEQVTSSSRVMTAVLERRLLTEQVNPRSSTKATLTCHRMQPSEQQNY